MDKRGKKLRQTSYCKHCGGKNWLYCHGDDWFPKEKQKYYFEYWEKCEKCNQIWNREDWKKYSHEFSYPENDEMTLF